jgi:phage terminase large subunit-like protein
VIESDHTFVILYELDPEDDWRDESCWIKAAPMIRTTPSLEYVRRYCADAQQTPGMRAEFETKVCNRWLHSPNGWLSMPAWDACADPALTLEAFAGERAYIGIDLAERDDIAAVAIGTRRSCRWRTRNGRRIPTTTMRQNCEGRTRPSAGCRSMMRASGDSDDE